MDCVEAKALRTGFGPEMTVKSGQQSFLDDGFGGNGTNVLAGDDFFVDDLLDFSNEDVEKGFVEEEKDSVSVSSQDGAENDNSNSGTFSFKDDDFGSIPGDELSVPTDDIADLEWLSHFFVDDSFMEFPAPCPTVNQKQKSQNQTQNQDEPKTKKISPERPCFPAIIPAKARSKRLRTGSRAWSRGSPSLTDSSSSSSSSSSTSSSPTSSLVLANRDLNLELFFSYGKPPPAKKQKKKNLPDSGGSLPQRRCSHCHVQKTPQWRTGPLGAKTLCNACGVRFKSGRLLPEYRPAISPTFSSEVHSNNHRKVLEMRRKKETVGPEAGLPLPVQSF